MKTIRELIEKETYEHIEYYLSLVDKYGEDFIFEGQRAMDDPAKFVKAILLYNATVLYLYYLKTGDERAEKALTLIKKFVKLCCRDYFKTWGKLYILRAMIKLDNAGMLDIIPSEDIEILKEITNYEDMLDKKEMKLLCGRPSNYFHVAMGCAGLRELLGWDTEPFCDNIKAKLLSIMENASDNGYMDEEPPYGRFDRYSMLLTSEFCDTLGLIKKEAPKYVLDNLEHVTKICVKMANEKGDGVNYGRSLSCHGDGAILEIFSTAFAKGLVAKEDMDVALLYSIRLAEKQLNFWYDRERRSYNLWWDGRSTNSYRGVKRVLEVNMDMASHMLEVLHNFEMAGLADTLPNIDQLPCPENWEATELAFSVKEDSVAKTIILRRKDTLVMLPLVGLGNYYMHAPYLPYPNICGVIEAAPEGAYPFLIPQYKTAQGELYRPIQFFTDVKTECSNESITVIAEGKLTKLGGTHPEKSEYSFKTTYNFCGDDLCAEFVTDLAEAEIEMLVGWHRDDFTITTTGFDTQKEEIVDGVESFKTPAGAITRAVSYTAQKAGKVSYKITLAEC